MSEFFFAKNEHIFFMTFQNNESSSSQSSDLLFQLCDKYDIKVVLRLFRDILDFLLERDLLTEFKLWKRQRQISMETHRMLERYNEPNSDESTDEEASSSSGEIL